MEIFWRLLFAHLLSDFTLQTNYVAAWKRRSPWGLFVHVTTHPVLYVLMAWPFLNDAWVETPWFSLTGWGSLAVIYVTHYLEDHWRIWSVTRHGAPDNFLFYAWDQVIHIVVLFAATPVRGPIVQSRWPLLGSLAVIVTHFATVTVYFVEKDLYGREYPSVVPKHAGILLRLLVFGCFFLPGVWWLAVLAVWALQWALARRVPALAFSRLTAALGNAIAVVSGLAGRFLFFYV